MKHEECRINLQNAQKMLASQWVCTETANRRRRIRFQYHHGRTAVLTRKNSSPPTVVLQSSYGVFFGGLQSGVYFFTEDWVRPPVPKPSF